MRTPAGSVQGFTLKFCSGLQRSPRSVQPIAWGVSSSTVSRSKEDLASICHLLAAIGLQVAPVDAVVVSRDDMHALERMAYKYLQTRIETDGGGY